MFQKNKQTRIDARYFSRADKSLDHIIVVSSMEFPWQRLCHQKSSKLNQKILARNIQLEPEISRRSIKKKTNKKLKPKDTSEDQISIHGKD